MTLKRRRKVAVKLSSILIIFLILSSKFIIIPKHIMNLIKNNKNEANILTGFNIMCSYSNLKLRNLF
jgi:hypothetical protein